MNSFKVDIEHSIEIKVAGVTTSSEKKRSKFSTDAQLNILALLLLRSTDSIRRSLDLMTETNHESKESIEKQFNLLKESTYSHFDVQKEATEKQFELLGKRFELLEDTLNRPEPVRKHILEFTQIIITVAAVLILLIPYLRRP